MNMDKYNSPITLERAKEIISNLTGLIESCKIEYGRVGKGDALEQDIKVHLNQLLESDGLSCTQVLITNNIDKQMFGIYILPTLSDWEIKQIVNNCSDDIVEMTKKFRMELDTKLFAANYTGTEIVAMMLSDIYSTMSPDAILRIRIAIDACICNTGRAAADYILKMVDTSGHECAILRYIIVSFLRNLYTFAGDDQILTAYQPGHILNCFGFNDIIKSIYKDRVTYINGGSNSGSELNMFRWAFNVLDDLDMHLSEAIDTLATIKSTTGSQLEANLIEGILKKLKEEVNMDVLDKSVKEAAMMEGFSLFKSLKTNGLRGIEDDLFEYKIRIKNCEDEEDAMFILRQINTRLTILSDYLANTDKLSDSERARWQADIEQYLDLRRQLGQKKLGAKKQYGIFIDYDKLDQL